jgi:integrase
MKGVRTPYPDPFLRPDRGSVYYFQYTDPRTGLRRQKSTGCSKKSDAIREVKKFIDRLETDEIPEQALPFSVYAEPFFIDGQCPRQARTKDERKRFSTRHMRDLRHGLERVVGRPASGRKKEYKPLPFSKILLGKITRSDVYDLRRSLAKDPGGRAGQQCVTAVKTVLSEAVILGHLETSPAAGIGPYKRPEADSWEEGSERRRDAFTLEEVRTLWSHRYELTKSRYQYARGFGREGLPDIRHGVALGLLLGLGLRVGELRALRWENVDLENGTVSIVEAVQDQAADAPIGPPKWGKLRKNLTLPEPVLADLRHHHDQLTKPNRFYVSDRVPVISDSDGNVVGPTWISKMWQRVKAAAEKLPEEEQIDFSDRWLTPHSCRHTLNTWLLIRGAPPLQVQTYLGWESEAGKALAQMQQHYGHLELAGTQKVAKHISHILVAPAEELADGTSVGA